MSGSSYFLIDCKEEQDKNNSCVNIVMAVSYYCYKWLYNDADYDIQQLMGAMRTFLMLVW